MAFAGNQLVYTRLGQRAKYVNKVGNQHLVYLGQMVRDTNHSYDAYEIFEQLRLVDTVYASCPIASYDQDISKRHAELEKLMSISNDLRDKILDLERQKDTMLNERTECLKRINEVEALKGIDDYIQGKITHFIVTPPHQPYDISIKPFSEAMEEVSNHRYNKSLKLLTLFGDTKGQLGWKINAYSDGSGSWTNVVPCRSLEEAQEKIKSIVAAEISATVMMLQEKLDDACVIDYAGIIKLAKRCDVEVPQCILDGRRTEMMSRIEQGKYTITDSIKKLTEIYDTADGFIKNGSMDEDAFELLNKGLPYSLPRFGKAG
jgi:hypothetical protein